MTFNKTLILCSSLFTSLAYSAGDEPVNCRQEVTGFQNIYAGTPSCEASYERTTCKPLNQFKVEVTSATLTHTISGNYRESESDSVRLSELIRYTESHATPGGEIIDGRPTAACTFPEEISETVSCTATLEFLERRPVKEQVCDYTPSATLVTDAFSYGEIYVSARGNDRDGTVESTKLLIDGIEQSSTSLLLNAFSGPYSLGQQIKVQSRVTDNDGYTTTQTQYVVFRDDIGLNPF